jgi:hypothetical protein
LAGDACQRRTSSLSNGRRRRHNDQRNGAYGDEAMHWMYEWLSVFQLDKSMILFMLSM